jgi:hypothetical protein
MEEEEKKCPICWAHTHVGTLERLGFIQDAVAART